jgi:hypothetical protein
MPKFVVEFTREVQVEYRGKITVSAPDSCDAEEKAGCQLLRGRVKFAPVRSSLMFEEDAVVLSVKPLKRKEG